jgi:hypothetical protein
MIPLFLSFFSFLFSSALHSFLPRVLTSSLFLISLTFFLLHLSILLHSLLFLLLLLDSSSLTRLICNLPIKRISTKRKQANNPRNTTPPSFLSLSPSLFHCLLTPPPSSFTSFSLISLFIHVPTPLHTHHCIWLHPFFLFFVLSILSLSFPPLV